MDMFKTFFFIDLQKTIRDPLFTIHYFACVDQKILISPS